MPGAFVTDVLFKNSMLVSLVDVSSGTGSLPFWQVSRKITVTV
ncbi:hypothetical protein BN2497_7665 [Janthinobacterium sp. CG23_2]|nr:hypothetical protein BN2497_7665 [Janthinobacterium sp. CG23_2]CUU30230.1 hypothetical protein BN3177_7665 [Janthinobacterium sp. CG23_2]